jgi:CHASE2 domain-containing sensor protein
VLYVLAMIAAVVVVDVLFLRHDFLIRLLVNIAIVALFVGGYFLFLQEKQSSGS